MRFTQNLPNFKTEYLNQEWKKEESLHYTFNFKNESLAEQSIKDVVKLKESHYSKITQWLGINNDKKINYYLYPSLKEKVTLMGDDSPGNAIWEELKIENEKSDSEKFEIHTIYNEKCKFIGEHEDTHLLSLPWGLSIYLFCEGLAQYMENNFMGEDLHIVTKKLLPENKLYPIEWLCANSNWEEVEPKIIYPQVESFTKYLIETYGKEKFKELYQNTSRHFEVLKNLSEIERIYNKTINQLKQEWLNFLKS
ncbi:MAG: hypothetical protein WC472_02065 [Candidatus Paceibacterota bacterium]